MIPGARMLLQAVRGSCALHGLHSPLRSAARTVASRCSQRVPRAAAAYTESYRVLQQDLADMDELLQAPRIKRAMARKQLELLAADAALLAFDVVAPQQYAALVAAQKELVAAQKELAAAQTGEAAQKDAAAQTGEAALVAAQKELVAAQKELVAAQKELAAAQTGEAAQKDAALVAAQKELAAAQTGEAAQKDAAVAAQEDLVAAQKELAASQKDVELAQMDAKILALDMKARAPVAALLSGSNRERGSGSGGSGIGGCSSPPSVTPCFERSRWCMTTCTAMAC